MSETSIWGRAVDLDAGKGGERKHQVLSSQGRFEMRRICSDHLLDTPSLTGAEGFFFKLDIKTAGLISHKPEPGSH